MSETMRTIGDAWDERDQMAVPDQASGWYGVARADADRAEAAIWLKAAEMAEARANRIAHIRQERGLRHYQNGLERELRALASAYRACAEEAMPAPRAADPRPPAAP